MEKISTFIRKTEKKKRAPHALSATSDLIQEAGLFTEKYKRGYWLRQLSNFQKKRNIEPASVYTHVIGLLKQMNDMDAKYNKGGWLTNQLKT